MSVQVILDITAELNEKNSVNLDTGGFDYAVVQFVNSGNETFAFYHSNDSGDIQSVSDGSAVSATNFVALQGINLANGNAVTNVGTSAIVRFQSYARYLQIGAATGPADKCLVRLYKIH